MIYLDCSSLIEVGYNSSVRATYIPKAQFTSNMTNFDFYEINSVILKLYQNTGVETTDLINFFKNCLLNSVAVGKVCIHYIDDGYVEDSNCEYEATNSYIKHFPFVLRGSFRDVRKFVHAMLLYCNVYDWDYSNGIYPVKDRNPVNRLIVEKYNNNLGRLLNEVMEGIKPFIDENFSSKNKEEILKDMPWALDPLGMELSRVIERSY